jgi:hypothetical protein
MLTLRITQTTMGQDRYRADVALEGDEPDRPTATSEFEFRLAAEDQPPHHPRMVATGQTPQPLGGGTCAR